MSFFYIKNEVGRNSLRDVVIIKSSPDTLEI